MSENTTISWDDFDKVDIRAGKIISVQDFPEAHKPAYKLVIDFGSEIGRKKSSAQITSIDPSALEGSLVAAVVNFPPKRIGPFISEVLTLGFADEDGNWIVISPIRDVPVGGRLQ